MDKPLVEFHPKTLGLTTNQTKVLKLLVEAAKLIVPIYELQENHKYPGANFYPHGVTKKEIEEAALDNPEILSPYTIVEKKNGKLETTSYHEKYARLLKPVAEKLIQASQVTENKEFSKRLELQANALVDGNYDEATLYWMSMKPYIIDINIGPEERYDDKLFFVKTSYQAWVGVMDKKETDRVFKYKDVILSARRKILMPSEKIDYYDKVQVRVDDSLIFSGLMARTKFVGVNLPNDPNLMEKYGSEITISKQANEARFRDEVLPAFDKLFSPEFRRQFSEEDLKSGSLYLVVLHELAHTYLRYRNSERNLQDLFPIIDELAAYVMGIKVCGSLLLKDIMNQKQLESIIIAYLGRSYSLIQKGNDKDQSRSHYAIGGAIFINYLLESGALKEAGGIHWPNFAKIYYCLDELATILERMLYQGTRADAEALIKRFGDTKKL